MNQHPSTETSNAIHYNTGQIWDAMRAMRTAFLIDHGLTPEPTVGVRADELPAWDDLTPSEQCAFVVSSARCAAHFAQAQSVVAQIHRGASS